MQIRVGWVAAGEELLCISLTGGKSGLQRARRRVTPGGGNPRESATENIPPDKFFIPVRVKRCGKSAPRFSGNGDGMVNPVWSKTK